MQTQDDKNILLTKLTKKKLKPILSQNQFS